MRTGWVMDFGAVDDVVKPLVEALDHTSLNLHLDNPTAENVAEWLAVRIQAQLPALYSVEVQETDRGGAIAYVR